MLNSQPISSLKGIGEKTAKLYEKLGVFTIADLLSDYPRAYDTFEPTVPVGNLMEDQVMAVCASLTKAPDLVRFNRWFPSIFVTSPAPFKLCGLICLI